MKLSSSGWLLAVLFLVILGSAARAVTIDGYASMGASESQGTAYTGSWVPWVANQRGFNFGGPGNPYNVAVGGARTSTLLTQGQHTQVRDLVQSGDVDVAFLLIGGNDFFNVGTSIADGSLSGPALNAWAQSVVTNINTAVDTVMSAGPTGMIVASMPDILLTPSGRSVFDTPIEIQRGTLAVDLVNSLLLDAMMSRNVVYIDLATAMRDINLSPLTVGGVPIDTVNASPDPDHFFQDGRHPAAVGNGVTANLFMTAVNVGFGTSYTPLSDLEILTIAGLAGGYTGETSQLPYSSYVITAVPEPSSLLLAATGMLALAVLARRRPRRRSVA